MTEDLALAERYDEADRPVSAFAGGDAVRFRMYPGGLRQLLEGWTKNFAVGAGATRRSRLALAVLWVAGSGSAAVAAADAARGELSMVLGAALYAAVAAQFWAMYARVGRFRTLTAVLFPLGLAVFLVVFARSVWRTHVRHSVTWRGREISTARSRG